DLSTSVHWMPTCPTRLIVNPLAIFAPSLPQVRRSHSLYMATALTLVPLALGYAANGEYHNTDSRGLYQTQHAHASSIGKTVSFGRNLPRNEWGKSLSILHTEPPGLGSCLRLQYRSTIAWQLGLRQARVRLRAA